MGRLYTDCDLSVVIPAKNEAAALAGLLSDLQAVCPKAEIIVVNDGSKDHTAEVVGRTSARLISHPQSLGNGAAIKTGARSATRELICCMDGDGQHRAADIVRLLDIFNQGYEMVVGARTANSQASLTRGLGNRFYNGFSSLVVGQKIEDLTSGMRILKTTKFRQFLHLLPNKFSYPTTITMAFFRSGYAVGYVPIKAGKRVGKSHLRIWRDGLRFLLIIFKIGTLYSPLKIFLPVALLHFLAGLGYYMYTFITASRFTNMSALLLTSSIMIFLLGLVSEQITTLTYADKSK